MNDETKPAKAGFFVRAEKDADADFKRIEAAIEAWYARHFHRAAVEGRAPISATDKADLVKAVTEATTKE